MKDISRRIKELREQNNISQAELAQKLFVTRQAVSSWETRKTRPDIEMLERISGVFNIDLTELLYGKEPKPLDKKKLIPIAVFGAGILSAFILLIFVLPYYNNLKAETFQGVFEFNFFTFAMWALFGCGVPLLLSVLNLSSDIYLKNTVIRRVCLASGIVITVIYIRLWLTMLGFIPSVPFFIEIIYCGFLFDIFKFIPVFSGGLLYLGIKKASPKKI